MYLAVLKSGAMFAFGELSEAQKQGSASLLGAASAEADFAPRTQVGSTRWSREQPIGESKYRHAFYSGLGSVVTEPQLQFIKSIE